MSSRHSEKLLCNSIEDFGLPVASLSFNIDEPRIERLHIYIPEAMPAIILIGHSLKWDFGILLNVPQPLHRPLWIRETSAELDIGITDWTLNYTNAF